jgi:hypothetical protein
MRYQSHAKLSGTRHVNAISAATLERLASRRNAEPFVDFVRLVERVLAQPDAPILLEILSSQVFAPQDDDDLFELLVGFGLVDRLIEHGYTMQRLSTVAGAVLPMARLRKGEDQIEVWWQRAVWTVVGGSGRLSEVLEKARMPQAPWRPDFIISRTRPAMTVLVEVKLTSRDVSRERDGLRDMFAYLFDATSHFTGKPFPHGIVVAWDAGARPASERVVIASQDTLGEALDIVLAA